MSIKTLLLSLGSVENTTNNFTCFVFKGNDCSDEFQGNVVEATNNLIATVQKLLGCDVDEAVNCLTTGYHHSIDEFDDFCASRGLPGPEQDNGDWVASFGDWQLFCMPQGTIGAVRGLGYWTTIDPEIENLNGVQSVHLA
jgi:hypothetical protein